MTALTLFAWAGAAAGQSPAEDTESAWTALLQHDRGVVWLQAGQQKVLALYDADRATHHRGTVILLHDMGQHPDWPQVVGPLRRGLARHGWSTLSVQMPVLPAGSDLRAYAPLVARAAPRIRSAVAYVKEHEKDEIALAGYGLGAAMAAFYLGGNDSGGIKAMVAVGMVGIGEQTPPLGAADLLAKVKVPVLDIYGTRDLEQVVRGAAVRAPPGAPPSGGAQQAITGADHRFTGMTDTLVRRVAGWLDREVRPPGEGPADAGRRGGEPSAPSPSAAAGG